MSLHCNKRISLAVGAKLVVPLFQLGKPYSFHKALRLEQYKRLISKFKQSKKNHHTVTTTLCKTPGSFFSWQVDSRSNTRHFCWRAVRLVAHLAEPSHLSFFFLAQERVWPVGREIVQQLQGVTGRFLVLRWSAMAEVLAVWGYQVTSVWGTLMFCVYQTIQGKYM